MLLSDTVRITSPNYKEFLYFIYNVMYIDQSAQNLQKMLCWKLMSCPVRCWKLHQHAHLHLIYMSTMNNSVDFVEQ